MTNAVLAYLHIILTNLFSLRMGLFCDVYSRILLIFTFL